jgi:outer membrane protein OmpA-like peptidoglycan-associated protein
VNESWIEGRFEGSYEGKRLADPRDAGRAKRFSFRVRSGEVRDAKVVDGPWHTGSPETTAETCDEIRQDRVGGITLAVPQLGIDRPETSLFDVRIVDWRLSRPAEANGRSHGRIEGTIRARLTPPQPEPLPDDQPDASPVAAQDQLDPPVDAPARGRARSRRKPDPSMSTRSKIVEGPDPHVVYDRLLWLAAIASWLSVALWLESACGTRVAATWAAASGSALCLRRVARSPIHAGSERQGWLSLGLVAAQVGVWLEPVTRGASVGCQSVAPIQLAALGGAMVAAALLRRRGAFIATSIVWTIAVCAWCASLEGACTAPVASADVTGPVESVEHRTAPRTSPDGHWPVMPGRREGSDGGGATTSNGGAGNETVGYPTIVQGAGLGASGSGDGFLDGRAGGLSPAGVTAPGRSTGDVLSATDAPPSQSPAAHMPSGRGGASSTRGGWVAADHRGAASTAGLISIEHANRVPDDFFGSDGSRRVYVPTDPIFEPGGAGIRAGGALQLGRIAALLDIHPELRPLLVVHTDIAGGLAAQQRMSERRAASVRSWLLDRGHLRGDQFEAVGVGANHPLVPTDGSYAAQQPNRRIEISLAD